jgi:hypothetical protein
MTEVTIIGLDLAKNVFQVHGMPRRHPSPIFPKRLKCCVHPLRPLDKAAVRSETAYDCS